MTSLLPCLNIGSPSLEFDLNLFDAGEARLDLYLLPTKPITPKRSTRVAVSLDDGAPEILNGPGGDVLANLRLLTTKIRIPSPGPHTLTVWTVDPGVALDKLVLDFRPPVESYSAPPESWRGRSAPKVPVTRRRSEVCFVAPKVLLPISPHWKRRKPGG